MDPELQRAGIVWTLASVQNHLGTASFKVRLWKCAPTFSLSCSAW